MGKERQRGGALGSRSPIPSEAGKESQESEFLPHPSHLSTAGRWRGLGRAGLWSFHPDCFHRPLPKLGANRTGRLERAEVSGCAARSSMSSGPGQMGWDRAPGRRQCSSRSFGCLEARAVQPGACAGPAGGAEAFCTGGGVCAARSGPAWLSQRPPGREREVSTSGAGLVCFGSSLCSRCTEGLGGRDLPNV